MGMPINSPNNVAPPLITAFADHPQRFKGLAPKPPAVPTAAWINPPKKETETPEIIIRSLNSSRLVSQSH
jgi:hypothetical protein